MNRRLSRLSILAAMGALSFIFMLFEVPLPFFPPFLKVDAGDLPALLTALLYGPGAGIGIEGIKNVLHYLIRGGDAGLPIGQAANFLAGSVYVSVAAWAYGRRSDAAGLAAGLALGALLTAVVMAAANYFILFPLYIAVLHYPIAREDILPLILTAIFPFNLVKGGLIGIVAFALYSRLHGWIRERRATEASAERR
ncbi:MAG: ECF transporter S component [Hydrogenibacillus schlegelii]|nr:ECF transporter S component [Hydrogenibacillus schlegelii]